MPEGEAAVNAKSRQEVIRERRWEMRTRKAIPRKGKIDVAQMVASDKPLIKLVGQDLLEEKNAVEV